MQYVPELTWILFLRILDAREQKDEMVKKMQGVPFTPALQSPYRWCDWAAPYDEEGAPEKQGWKRKELQSSAQEDAFFDFVNTELLPHLHQFDKNENVTQKQQVIGQIMTAVERVRVDSETNFFDILDKIHEINIDHVDDTHFFTLSQVYEDLLLKMGEKNSDGGQFFTPREIIRAMIRTLEPRLGETIYDPCCGTGGFLAQGYEYLEKQLGEHPSSTDLATLKTETFYGREKENLVYPIALANLILHGIDQPHIWHGNALTDAATNKTLFSGAPEQFDLILTNPPFGGKEGKDAQKHFDFETGATQVLFLQKVLRELAPDGSCGIVLDEGLLFRTNEEAFVETKRKLLDECNLWCIVSLPGGVFSTAGAGVKTNLLFFTKEGPTETIWYYDLSWVKVGKKTPLTLAHFGFATEGTLENAALPANLVKDWQDDADNADKPFPSFARLKDVRGTEKGEGRYSWAIDFSARKAKAREEMLPHKQTAMELRKLIVELREQLAALRKQKPQDKQAIKQCQEKIQAKEKLERAAEAKAAQIDAAVYDLKAVNPYIKEEIDTRQPLEVITAIEQRGAEVDAAMSALRKLLQPS